MNKDKDLNELRNEIRTIDKELVKLFEKRMTLCRAVGETKLKSQAPVFDAVREEENIRNLTALIENVTDKMYFTGWYRSLMDISKEIQRSICKKTGMNYGRTLRDSRAYRIYKSGWHILCLADERKRQR